jgi:hypothetical protein
MLKRKPSERPSCGGDEGDANGGDDHFEKNPYKNRPPDFAELAAKHPDLLGRHVRLNKTTGRGSLDFTDIEAAEALTRTLLLHDFGLKVEILKGHLCPPLPNRINYLCWLSDLLEANAVSSAGSADAPSATPVRVLDIGVGPVGIYPLLGHSLFRWSFVGSDIDSDAIEHCQRNLDANPQLAGSISLVQVSGSTVLQDRIVRDYLSGLSSADRSANSTQGVSVQHTLVSLQSLSGDSQPRPPKTCQGGPIMQVVRPIEPAVVEGIVSQGNAGNATVQAGRPTFHAVMCNPPFYDNDENVRELTRILVAMWCALTA